MRLGPSRSRMRRDGTLECRAPDDAVVNHNEVVLTSLDGAVGNVVDVRHQDHPDPHLP